MTAWFLTDFSLGTMENYFAKNYFALLCDQGLQQSCRALPLDGMDCLCRCNEWKGQASPVSAFSFHKI